MRSEELIIIVRTASGWRLLLALCVRSSQSSAAGEPDLSAAAAAPREKSHDRVARNRQLFQYMYNTVINRTVP
jgi:hypothetical protein